MDIDDLTDDELDALASKLAGRLPTGRHGDRIVTTRRQLLVATLGGSAGVAALVKLGIDPATAQSAAGQVGTQSSPEDVWAYDLDVQNGAQFNESDLSGVESLSTVDAQINHIGPPGDRRDIFIYGTENSTEDNAYDSAQAAIDELNNSGVGGTVLISRGLYEETIDIPGYHITVDATSMQSGARLETTNNEHVITLSGSDPHLKAITPIHNGSGDYDAVHVQSTEPRIENVSVDVAPRNAIRFGDGAQRGLLRGSELAGGDNASLAFAGDSRRCNATEMVFEEPPSTAIHINSSRAGAYHRATNFTVLGAGDDAVHLESSNRNTIEGTIQNANGNGVVVDSDQNRIDVSVFGGDISDALLVSGQRNTIDITAPYASVSLTSSSGENVVRGMCNGLTDNGTNNDTDGLLDRSTL